MAYVSAKVRFQYEDFAYKSYLADAAMYLTENTSKLAGGTKLNRRFADIVTGNVDNRSGEEIIEDVIKKAGLEVVD